MQYSPLEQFEILTLIPLQLGAFDLSFTNASLLMVLSLGALIVLNQLIAVEGNGLLVPSRWQTILESIYSLVSQMLSETVGSKSGEFVPFIFTLFSFILTCNLMGLVPYSYTITSQLILTISLGWAIWLGKLLIGFRFHGLRLFGMFLPSGIPFALAPFFILLEVLGFIIPVISLSVRLFANLMSGHILLKILFGFSWTMMLSSTLLFIAHFIPLSILFILFGLETGVAIIQAYVFTILSCIYISDMVHGGH